VIKFPFQAETLWHLYLVSKLITYLTPWMRQSSLLTLTLLTWRLWWALNNASRWQMGFNSAFKGLIRLGKQVFVFHGAFRFTDSPGNKILSGLNLICTLTKCLSSVLKFRVTFVFRSPVSFFHSGSPCKILYRCTYGCCRLIPFSVIPYLKSYWTISRTFWVPS